MYLKTSSGRWRSFYSSLNVLNKMCPCDMPLTIQLHTRFWFGLLCLFDISLRVLFIYHIFSFHRHRVIIRFRVAQILLIMMTSSNGNISSLLALCAGNSPVTSEFLAQRPVTRSFDAFFDLRLNKQSTKQSWDWWFETPSRSLWRHCNVYML